MKQKNVILMVVAVGCGLVAAFLTSQMSAKAPVEQVEVIVAAKDLPVGTMITRDDLKDDKVVKVKKIPKDGLPPAFISNKEDLVDKRLSRPVRAEETFNPQDLSKGGSVTLPDGYDLMSLQINVAQAAAGFIGPGSRVDVMASLRLGNTLKVFKLLVNMLVINVDQQVTYDKTGTFPSMNMIGFAVTDTHCMLLELAKARGCSLSLKLRHPNKSPDGDKDYKVEDVMKLLQDSQNPTEVKVGEPGSPTGDPPKKPVDPTVKPVDPKDPGTPSAPAPRETVVVVKVLVAKEDIAPNTLVTADLVKDKFELKVLPAEFAGDAMADLSAAYDKAFKTGVSRGQWVTPGMVGLQATKVSPVDRFEIPKPSPDTKPVGPQQPAVKRNHHDVAVHTTSGTVINRYEEVRPGVWKKVAELTPEQAAQDDKPATPKAGPDATKSD